MLSEDDVDAVTVVVPCRNECATIESCLRGILAQEALPDGRGLEVIVADGLSDDGTREKVQTIAAGDPRVRLIDNPGRIVSTGLNAALAAARGKIIVRMDAHTEYAPDYVRQCVAVLEETGADNVGGPWVARGDTYMSGAIAAAFQSPFAIGGARSHDPHFDGPLDSVYLGCWSKQTLLRQGGFDEQLVRNQDDELNFRLIQAGGVVWQSPRIRSWYRPRSSLAALFRQYLQYGYWKVLVIQKHRRPASPRHLVPVLFVLGAALGWLPALAYPRLGWVYLGAWAAYAGLAVLFSVRAAARTGYDLLPILPLVFLTFHFGYGLGFALGVVDAVVLRRGARPAMSALTRSGPMRIPAQAGETRWQV